MAPGGGEVWYVSPPEGVKPKPSTLDDRTTGRPGLRLQGQPSPNQRSLTPTVAGRSGQTKPKGESWQ